MISDEEGKKKALQHTIKNVPGRRNLMKRCRKTGIKKSTYREFKNGKKDASVVNA